MTDLNKMIDSLPLKECKAEIDSQFSTLSGHRNEMKTAVVASLFLNNAIDTLYKIDPLKFFDSLRSELQNLIARGEKWEHEGLMYREHLNKNKDVISEFQGSEEKVAVLSAEIEKLLKDYDNILKKICLDHSRKSIADIESEINRLNS